MTKLLSPQYGARPWLPADSAVGKDVLNMYNIPLVGLIEQGGATFLYACLLGELEAQNIWAYGEADQSEVALLSSAGDNELADVTDHMLANRELIVAHASDYELIDWLKIIAGPEKPLAIAKRFLAEMRTELKKKQRNIEELSSLERLFNSSVA